MRLAEVVHALGTQRNAHVSGVVSVVGLIAVSAYCFAMRSNIVIVVSPGSILADTHANPFSELAEPGYSCYIWTDCHAGTIASLVAILMVRTFSNTQIGNILSESSGNCRTGNHTHRSVGRIVAKETGLAVCSCIEELVALRNTHTSYIVCKTYIGDVQRASWYTSSSNVLAEVKIGSHWAEKRYNASTVENVGVGRNHHRIVTHTSA